MNLTDCPLLVSVSMAWELLDEGHVCGRSPADIQTHPAMFGHNQIVTPGNVLEDKTLIIAPIAGILLHQGLGLLAEALNIETHPAKQ